MSITQQSFFFFFWLCDTEQKDRVFGKRNEKGASCSCSVSKCQMRRLRAEVFTEKLELIGTEMGSVRCWAPASGAQWVSHKQQAWSPFLLKLLLTK